jgi:hypothetical protein
MDLKTRIETKLNKLHSSKINLNAKEIIFKVKIGFDHSPSTIWKLGPLRVKQHEIFKKHHIKNVAFQINSKKF